MLQPTDMRNDPTVRPAENGRERVESQSNQGKSSHKDFNSSYIFCNIDRNSIHITEIQINGKFLLCNTDKGIKNLRIRSSVRKVQQ